jgi:hypothetical protein
VPASDPSPVRRRTLLQALGATGAASLAGCAGRDDGTDAPATEVTDERADRLAERFAPTLYFDADERWFPTDPRPYESERDGRPVVDGFDAFDGYTRRFEESGEPPDPTVFSRVVRYEASPLAVVQYWLYSAFDQFTTNFHWHDWELLQVFVDTETEEPQLYVASAHSRTVPNNEYLDPDPEAVPRILSELGSHSSALSVNERPESFQRFSIEDSISADITNRTLDALEALVELPAAYGLPRDEGLRLPYIVPELDGAPIYEDDRLPSVDRSSLVPETLTVRSFDALSSPPRDLPERSTGVSFDHEARDRGEADVRYELVPTREVEHVEAFTGPQLSFEFAVPEFAEDAVASHITAAGVPWSQPRYDDPETDITDPTHRAALAERYAVVTAPSPVNSVVAAVTEALETDEAPSGEGLTTRSSPVETIALLESDPVAVPTFAGVAVARDVEPGDHRLTVNGAGVAPHSERVSVADDGGVTTAGVGGEIPLVAREDAIKLGVDADGTEADLTRLAVDDDFAGRLYDAPIDGPDAVYVHRGGAYAAEVRDADDAVGAFRVNPTDESAVTIEEPNTGKAPLAQFVADLGAETAAQVGEASGRAGGRANAIDGLARALEAVASAAGQAAGRAAAGDRGPADRALETVAANLDRVEERLSAAGDGLPDPLANATGRRLAQARRRTEQALAAEKL